jgi:hypothetical protein
MLSEIKIKIKIKIEKTKNIFSVVKKIIEKLLILIFERYFLMFST